MASNDQPNPTDAPSPNTFDEGLTIVGHDGVDRIRMSTGELPGIIDVLDKDGNLRVRMATAISPNGTTPIGSAGLNVYSLNGALTARIGTSSPPRGGVSVLLRDQEERDRIKLSVGLDGEPTIEMFDAEGNVIWSAP